MDKLFEAMAKVLLAETDDTIIGQSRDEYEDAMLKSLDQQKAEQDAIAAFMQKNKLKTNDGGVLGTSKRRGGGRKPRIRGNNFSGGSTGPQSMGGDANSRRVRSLAYGLQGRLGVEVEKTTGRAFDAAVQDYSRFMKSGAPRVDRETGDFKPMDPLEIVYAYKQFYTKIPHDSQWASKV